MMSSLAALLLLAPAAAAHEVAQDSADAVLERAAAAYQATTTLRADFLQKIEIPALEREEEGRGVVYQKKPNYFLMRFEDPKGDLVVADGEYFWMYYPSAQPDQVVRTSIGATAQGATLGGQFLVNPKERYVATYVGQESVGDRSAHLLSLVPKFDAPYTLVRVWVDVRDHLVRRFEIHEENGTVRTMTLRNLETGVELPNRMFAFAPPPGVEVFTR